MPSTFDHLKSIIQLPFVVVVVVPTILYVFSYDFLTFPFIGMPSYVSIACGSVALILGLVLFVKSLKLFIDIGNGTLAPWNPTKKMIIQGLYRYVRNPMLIGVNFLLLSEALLLRSSPILIWMIFFILLNTVYFIKKEEPDLLKKFGEEYAEYCKHVPRWLPRLTPYRPEAAL